MKTSWAASDSLSGVQGYYVYRSTDSGSYVYQGFQAANSLTQYLASGHRYRYEVFALDNAGNESAGSVGSNDYLHLTQENSSSIAYSSGWTTQTVSGASGGKVKYSSGSGKTAKLSFTGSRVAWVTTLGSNRGSASVYANVGSAATVSLHASATTASYVAFVGSYSTGGHTLTVKNLGSSAPRVDVDAFLWIGG